MSWNRETNTTSFIRLATLEDGGAMLEFDDYAKSNIRRCEFVREAVEACECLVAVESGSVVGYLVLRHDFFENGFVSLVVVSPAFQRQGIALRLLAASELACKTSKLFTSANTSNIASRKLIARAGFLPSGVIENLDEDDSELVYFKRIR